MSARWASRGPLLARLLVGAVLVAAGVAKLAWPEEHVDLPQRLPWLVGAVRRAAPFLGALEVVLGLLLLQPRRRWQQRAALVGTAFFMVAVVYLLWLQASGLSVSSCGCLGSAVRLSLGTHLMLSGALLALLVLVAVASGTKQSPAPTP